MFVAKFEKEFSPLYQIVPAISCSEVLTYYFFKTIVQVKYNNVKYNPDYIVVSTTETNT